MSRAVAEHQQAVRSMLDPLATRPAELIGLRHAPGRVLAADVVSPIDLPVFGNSQMDGYAVAAADVAAVPVQLPVQGVLAAGAVAQAALAPRSAIKIMTGAPIPTGADCVVPVEDTTLSAGVVTITRGRVAGEFIRAAGSDIQAGQTLAMAGTLLAPRHIAAFAAAGAETVPVRRRIRAAVITTGDELVPAGTTLGPGQLYDSNGIALAAVLRETGTEVVSVAHAPDDATAFRAILAAATAVADIVFTSGGVSMGDFEVVRETLTPLGGKFGHVAMQPGGPQGLSMFDGVAVLSFPGNPVSTLVSFAVFARPILRALAGLAPAAAVTARLGSAIRSPAGKCQFLRGQYRDGEVTPVPGAGSHLIASMAHANALVEIDAEVTALDAGANVRVWPI